MCLGRWHGEHGRRRKWAGVVVRAIAAYFDAGGKYDDVDKLKIAAGGKVDLLGYGTEDLIAQDAPELTSELLTRAISPTLPTSIRPNGASWRLPSLANWSCCSRLYFQPGRRSNLSRASRVRRQ
jgi:hypothetical protein